MNLISTPNHHSYSNIVAKHMEIILWYLSHLATFLNAECLKIFIIWICIKFIMKPPLCYSKNSVRISFEKTHNAPPKPQLSILHNFLSFKKQLTGERLFPLFQIRLHWLLKVKLWFWLTPLLPYFTRGMRVHQQISFQFKLSYKELSKVYWNVFFLPHDFRRMLQGLENPHIRKLIKISCSGSVQRFQKRRVITGHHFIWKLKAASAAAAKYSCCELGHVQPWLFKFPALYYY